MEMFTLKTARERSGMDMETAAKAIGVSVDTLSNYERGKSFPKVPTIKSIEKVYGVSYNQLIFCESNTVKS